MKFSSGMTALVLGIVSGFVYLWLALDAYESGKLSDALLWLTAGALLIAGMLLTQRRRKSSCDAQSGSSPASH